jgi:hypothetical protein
MILIKNKIIPPKGFKAVSIWPFVFARKELNNNDINHERIHLRQQVEMLIIPFYILYLIFTLINGYSKNPFEKEAYENEHNIDYLNLRKLFSWIKYIK